MKQVLDNLTSVFQLLKKDPSRSESVKKLIRDQLNKLVPEIQCDKIYFSNPSTSSFYAMVIPKRFTMIIDPNGDPETMTSKHAWDNPSTYDVDIDLSTLSKPSILGGLTPREMSAWLIHEMCHNILTTTTTIRFRMLLFDMVEFEKLGMYNEVLYRPEGAFLWVNMFSRTAKEAIVAGYVDWEADRSLLTAGYANDYNNALNKFIEEHGGDSRILSDDYVTNMDIAAFKLTNRIVRSDLVTRRMPQGATWSMLEKMKEFISQDIQSELLDEQLSINNYSLGPIAKEGGDAITSSADAFKDFGDKIVESVTLTESFFGTRLNYTKTELQLDEIEIYINGAKTTDDKLLLIKELRYLIARIKVFLDENPGDQKAVFLKDRGMELVDKLSNVTTQDKKSRYGIWVANVPEEYRG